VIEYCPVGQLTSMFGERVEVAYCCRDEAIQGDLIPGDEWTVNLHVYYAPELYDPELDGEELNGYETELSQAVAMPPGQAVALSEMIAHAAGHAAENNGVCIECGDPLDEHETDDDDDADAAGESVGPLVDAEYLTLMSDSLDDLLDTLRDCMANGDPQTTVDLRDMLLRSMNGTGDNGVDDLALFAATAIQRLALVHDGGESDDH
jgi:hypothetical protein